MKATALWIGALFLALLAPLVWPPSTTAQQLRHSLATVNLGPTINLAFGDIHLASLRSDKLPFNSETKHGQTDPHVKRLPCGNRKLSQELFAGPNGAGLTNAAFQTKLVGTSPVVRGAGSSTPMMGSRLEVARVSPAESERMQRLPALYQEDTPFSTQVRMPIADLWGGRLRFDAFYREISADSVFRGLPQVSGVWWATSGSLTLRSAKSYGIHLSFRMPHIHTRTLHRYLFSGGT